MGYVYLISKENSDIYKVGVTRKAIEESSRVKSIQTGNERKVSVLHAFPTDIPFKVETILHRRWKSKKYIPEDFKDLEGEWFHLTNKDVDTFILECTKIENNIYLLEKKSTYFETDKHI